MLRYQWESKIYVTIWKKKRSIKKRVKEEGKESSTKGIETCLKDRYLKISPS